MILTLPIGFVGQLTHPCLRFLYLIKVLRIMKLYSFLEPAYFMPMIRQFYSGKLECVLKDKKKRNSINESNDFIMQRLRAQNYFNSIRIFIYIATWAYLVGTLWALLANWYLKDNDNEDNFYAFFDIQKASNFENQVLSIYYCFTTISTTGLGDLYPISNIERIMSSFMMLFGVITFSYIVGTFSRMIRSLR